MVLYYSGFSLFNFRPETLKSITIPAKKNPPPSLRIESTADLFFYELAYRVSKSFHVNFFISI